MLFSIYDDITQIKCNEGNFCMPEQSLNNIASIFPDWIRTLVMLFIAMTSSAVISLSKSRYSGAFVFSAWIINIGIAMIMAFLMDSLAMWMQPDMNIKAEMALMVITGMLAKDILEIAEKKGLQWINWKTGPK